MNVELGKGNCSPWSLQEASCSGNLSRATLHPGWNCPIPCSKLSYIHTLRLPHSSSWDNPLTASGETIRLFCPFPRLTHPLPEAIPHTYLRLAPSLSQAIYTLPSHPIFRLTHETVLSSSPGSPTSSPMLHPHALFSLGPASPFPHLFPPIPTR